MAQADRAVIDKWLVMLATATASGGMALADLEAKVTLYGDFLASEFDAGAFTRRSLQDVAAQCKFFPAYGELVPLLRAWWRENRPPTPTLANPATAHLSADDRQWVAYWHRRQAEDFGASATHPATSRGTVLSLIRQQSPAAYAAITGVHELPRRGPTEAEVEAVRVKVEQALRAAHEVAHPGRESQTADSPPPPLPDVTHKGELLRQRREARGVVVPLVAKPPEVAEDAQTAPDPIQHEAAE